MKTYLYARISRKSQNIQRQITNLTKAYPDGILIQEAFTGTTLQRPKFERLLKQVKQGDTIVFDSVSRMSRSEAEGIEQYMELFNKGINLIFLKVPHINTDTYKKQIEGINIPSTDNKVVNLILEGVTNALKELAKEQIRLAFEQAEKEVEDLHQRTKEGIETAKLAGKQIGKSKGDTWETKKSKEVKQIILKHSKDFNGTLADIDVMKLAGVARKTYYKYKKELRETE